MEDFGYKIKIGKYLAFRHKDKKETGRFTRTKANVLGENYTKEKIKERIEYPNKDQFYNQKYHYEKDSYKKTDTVVDMKNNEKEMKSIYSAIENKKSYDRDYNIIYQLIHKTVI